MNTDRCAANDLKTVLTREFLPRPVTPELRARRQRLCDYIRAHEERLYDTGDRRAGTVRTLLGWDDETMAAFVDSPLLCQSSPHAGMNSFGTSFAYPWILKRAVQLAEERHGAPAVHMRTQVTHHNFSDTFARPHAWWRRGTDGGVVKTSLFVRQPVKHHPILSKPAPAVDHATLHPVDREAVELAELARDYATYTLIYRAHLERALGFHVPHRTIETPIDLINRFTVHETGLLPWFDAVAAVGQTLRLEVPDAPLAVLTRPDAQALAAHPAAWPERAVIGSNYMNFGQFYQLGLSMMVGGHLMAAYVPELNATVAAFASHTGWWTCEPPSFIPVTKAPSMALLGLDEETAYCRSTWGVTPSLSLVASAMGAKAADRLEPMLATDYDELFDRSLIKHH